jgi:signal transduction histidine kinase
VSRFPRSRSVLLLLIGAFFGLWTGPKAAGADDFAEVPLMSIKTIEASRKQPPTQPVKVKGTVTLMLYSGSVLFLQDATGAIGAEGPANQDVHVGDLIEAIGTLEKTGYSRTLGHCVFRRIGPGPPIPPRLASGPELKSGSLDMLLVRVQGPLLRDPILRPDAQVLEIKVDQAFVSLLVTDVAGSPLSQLRPGSVLQATGVCSVGPDTQGRPAWIRIFLRPADLRVLQGPPWWTPERMSLVLGLIAATGLAGMAWMVMLRHRGLSRALENRVREGTAELRARTAELERLNRELEAFSYSVSHDLRAPLRAMAGFSQALNEDYGDTLDPIAKGYLKRIDDAALHMNQLIDGLLALAKVTRRELHREPTNLSDLTEGVVEELKRGHPNRKVGIAIERGMIESVDRDLIRIVLTNLLQNAWKFSCKTPDPNVQVGRLVDKKPAVYYVRDNGAGFDPGHAERLFQPFQRLHSAAEYEGTGIGLATVAKAVRRHGGRIWAEGKVNEGACFFFTVESDPLSVNSTDDGTGMARCG